jgi:hypothetical protein
VYRIRILDAGTRELAGLDKPVGRRIVERIHWLAENVDEVKRRLQSTWACSVRMLSCNRRMTSRT